MSFFNRNVFIQLNFISKLSLYKNFAFFQSLFFDVRQTFLMGKIFQVEFVIFKKNAKCSLSLFSKRDKNFLQFRCEFSYRMKYFLLFLHKIFSSFILPEKKFLLGIFVVFFIFLGVENFCCLESGLALEHFLRVFVRMPKMHEHK